jgi:tRNA A-37 threonylcarbamoyl transferase component Bud32
VSERFDDLTESSDNLAELDRLSQQIAFDGLVRTGEDDPAFRVAQPEVARLIEVLNTAFTPISSSTQQDENHSHLLKDLPDRLSQVDSTRGALLYQTLADFFDSTVDQNRTPVHSYPVPDCIGKYLIQREVGRGAFGIVYLAHDTQLNRSVAIKVPRHEVLVDRGKLQRFVSEATSAARLEHPNIVPIFEADLDGQNPYIASAFCTGPNLAQWLGDREQPVAWQDAATFVAQIANAVGYAHRNGVSHRDLKPANILLSPRFDSVLENRSSDGAKLTDFDPLVADFGLAKLADTKLTDTRSSVLVGTPLYMAPEQIDSSIGRGESSAIDIYSLGVILFEILTGRAPSEGETFLELLDCIRAGRTQKLRAIRKDVPRDLDQVCSRCLQPNPTQRYASADALADDLRCVVAGTPIEKHSFGLLPRVWFWCQRPQRIAEAAWSTIVIQVIWTTWILATDGFIGLTHLQEHEVQFGSLMRDTLVIIMAIHAPLVYCAWKALQGKEWGSWAVVAISLFSIPGLIASIVDDPVIFATVYFHSTPWFAFAVYFMLIMCFVIQAAYHGCALIAIHHKKSMGRLPLPPVFPT